MNMDKILVGRSLLYNIQSTTRNQLISSSSSYFVAYFRSTPACFDKWKNKWNNNSSDFGGPKPSKTYTKYKTRQLRADAKKALKDLFNCRTTSKFTLEGEFLKKGRRICFEDPFNSIDNKTKRDPLKSSTRRANKAHQKRNKIYKESREGDFLLKNLMMIPRHIFMQILEIDNILGLLDHGKSPLTKVKQMDLNGEMI
ncbi:uncharacterized protein [Rutidosis leptorrhynchoides]|uniref:uncharacterized protein n=1 Tax=Rutidosis leptorrhynchoides TaxID=125765 RepID=UPI003A98FF87